MKRPCFLYHCIISSFLLLVLFSCGTRSEEDKAKNLVVDVLTDFYDGDIDTYIAHSDFGTPLTPRKDSLLRVILSRYIDEVERKGGLQSIEPLHAQLDDDSTARVTYILHFCNDTHETCIKRLKCRDGEWKICVSE